MLAGKGASNHKVVNALLADSIIDAASRATTPAILSDGDVGDIRGSELNPGLGVLPSGFISIGISSVQSISPALIPGSNRLYIVKLLVDRIEISGINCYGATRFLK